MLETAAKHRKGLFSFLQECYFFRERSKVVGIYRASSEPQFYQLKRPPGGAKPREPTRDWLRQPSTMPGWVERERKDGKRARERERWKGDKSTISCPMNELSVLYKCRLVGN